MHSVGPARPATARRLWPAHAQHGVLDVPARAVEVPDFVMRNAALSSLHKMLGLILAGTSLDQRLLQCAEWRALVVRRHMTGLRSPAPRQAAEKTMAEGFAQEGAAWPFDKAKEFLGKRYDQANESR